MEAASTSKYAHAKQKNWEDNSGFDEQLQLMGAPDTQEEEKAGSSSVFKGLMGGLSTGR